MKPLPIIVTLFAGAVILGGFLLLGKTVERRGGREAPGSSSAPGVDSAPDADAELQAGGRRVDESGEQGRSRIGSLPGRAMGVTEGSTHAPATKDEVARIVGRCVDTLSHPLAGAEVSCPRRDLSTTSGEDGRFVLEIELGSGMHASLRLRVQKAGLGGAQLVAALRSGETTDLGDVLLRATGTLLGRVVDGDGRPLGAAQVQVEEALDVQRGTPFEGVSNPLLEGECDAQGAFRFDDVPVGSLRVWAGGRDARWSWTDTLELRPFQTLDGILLEVVPLDPEDTIELLVVDPSGQPSPDADVRYRYSTGYRSGSGSLSIDENGRGRQFLAVRAQYSFHARDKERRFRPAVARDVAPGTRDLVLRLAETKTFALRVRDAAGRPVDDFQAKVTDEAEQFQGTDVTGAETPKNGEVNIVSPVFLFRIKVDAQGFKLADLGPYDPEHMPSVVEARLEALPGIKGRVLSGTGPVPRARVSLHREIGADRRYVINGFPARSERNGAAGRANMRGEFMLTLREAGRYYLRAQATGFAPGEAGPFELDPESGASGLEVLLDRGGNLVGRVLVFADEESAGRIVGISRGDGFGVTGRTDANGEFRFDGLLPGRWLVESRQDEIRSNSTTTSRGSSDERVEIPWNCEVRAGETTRHELDLRTLRRATLAGEFLLDGKAPEDWRATLAPVVGAGQETRSAMLDSRGRFSISTSALGTFQLTLRGLMDRTSFVSVVDSIDLEPGDNAWSHDLAAGPLEGSIAESVQADSVIIESEAGAGPGFEVRVVPSPDGDFRISEFPAGKTLVRWRTRGGSSGNRTIEHVAGVLSRVLIP